jgi:ion channel POLLUX/CASTOR
MNDFNWKNRFKYQFDNLMSKGTPALIAGLALFSLLIIVFAALLVVTTKSFPEGQDSLNFLEAAWGNLMRTMDAGNMADDSGWPFRLLMFGVTLGGIFVLSTLIGVLTNGINAKLENLRKGRSLVMEKNHTVILGWSPLIFSLISELVIANNNQKRACIAVMGDMDKVDMEDAIKANVADWGPTHLVCRTGSMIDLNDLRIVSLDHARSIIILSPDSENADADVIKTILAITNNPDRRKEPYHIVAEIRDPKNMQVAQMVGRDEVELILVGGLISRIVAQTCRQSGLSVVYNELLDFGGDEIYFKEEPALTGKTFSDTLMAYEKSAVIGLVRQGGAVLLNPPMTTRLEKGDKIIAISEDDDSLHLALKNSYPVNERAVTTHPPTIPVAEQLLILGWNWRVPTIINELDNYVSAGSKTVVMAQYEHGETELSRLCPNLQRQSVTFMTGDTTDRRTLDSLKVSSFDHIIVLAYSDTMDKQEADAVTLITLLHLRDMADKMKLNLSIVSEMLDLRNRDLAQVTRADDFIVSDRLISLMMAQISENKKLNAVFTDLFDPEGSEIYLKSAGDYVAYGVTLNYYTVMESARRRGEVAIGYRLQSLAENPQKGFGVVVNPLKTDQIVFGEDDQIIVLAENG